ncbi:MAG: shikimate dehydrogenase [Oscillospiraceae bacterium]|nr:shikimate dehydrogenase [Oscillospiraceae bacterium]
MADKKRLAVIGDPIAHSLSPRLHNAMAAALGLPYAYEAVRVAADGLPAWLDRVRREGWAGFNATMPHKLHLIPLLDRMTDQAVYFGAVNTVRNDGGVLTGHNTDGDGFARMLAEHGLGFAGAHVTLLGAGGAAGAIARKALQDGAARITVHNRTVSRAAALCEADLARMTAAGLDAPVAADTNLLINTLPVGSGLECGFVSALGRDCAVVDILYAPPRTPLLLAAEERGLLAVNGLGMLIHQAILAFEFFTGAAVDATAMAPVLYRAAGEGGG